MCSLSQHRNRHASCVYFFRSLSCAKYRSVMTMGVAISLAQHDLSTIRVRHHPLLWDRGSSSPPRGSRRTRRHLAAARVALCSPGPSKTTGAPSARLAAALSAPSCTMDGGDRTPFADRMARKIKKGRKKNFFKKIDGTFLLVFIISD